MIIRKIYNLSDVNQVVLFMSDCVDAINKCPNEVGWWNNSLELDIIKGKISAEEVFDKYNNPRCPLNSKDYREYLSDKAINTFKYVYEYGRYGLKRLCQDGVVYKKYGWSF